MHSLKTVFEVNGTVDLRCWQLWIILCWFSVIGQLDAPTNLQSSFSGSMLFTSWSAPFTLDGISICYYHIIFTTYNVTSLEQAPHNISYQMKEDTSILFAELLDNNSCIVYETCVQAVTAAGLGEAACVNNSRIRGNYARK